MSHLHQRNFISAALCTELFFCHHAAARRQMCVRLTEYEYVWRVGRPSSTPYNLWVASPLSYPMLCYARAMYCARLERLHQTAIAILWAMLCYATYVECSFCRSARKAALCTALLKLSAQCAAHSSVILVGRRNHRLCFTSLHFTYSRKTGSRPSVGGGGFTSKIHLPVIFILPFAEWNQI